MPIANRTSLGLLACQRALKLLRGGLTRVLLSVALTCLGFAPLAQGLQFQAAAGLQEREAATYDLAAARKETLDAQTEAQRTRLALDKFLSSHLDAQREVAALEAASDAGLKEQTKHRHELQSQLAELQSKRVTLLETLTEEHPEVIEVSSRIEAIQGRLRTSEVAELPSQDESSTATGPALDAASYQRLLGNWRTAERRLESARLAEAAAADRLAAVTNLLLHSPAARDEMAAPSPDRVQSHSPTEPKVEHQAADSSATVLADSHHEQASRTQTLALASLALAVMLAALAAVRLARATSDPLFASADEVSASLAVPVVGIVPFGVRNSRATDAGMRRGFFLLGQITLALALFGAVAYAVVHFDAVLHLLSDPVGTLRSWFGL